jgi:hypothetical protein
MFGCNRSTRRFVSYYCYYIIITTTTTIIIIIITVVKCIFSRTQTRILDSVRGAWLRTS